MPTLYEVGEDKLIEWLLRRAPGRGDRTVLANGNDAAVVSFNGRCVLKTDTLVSPLPLAGGSPFDVGWKAAAACVSDVAAVGGRPEYALVSIGAPRNMDASSFRRVVSGVDAACKSFSTLVLGGDLSEMRQLVVTVSILGSAPYKPMPRGCSRPGDVVAVSREFGLEPLGLRVIMDRVHVVGRLRNLCVRRFVRPIPEVSYGLALSSTGVVHSCTDSSDGLLTAMSNLIGNDADIVLDRPPTHPLLKPLGERFTTNLVLNGGEEYALVYAYPREEDSKIVSALSKIRRRRIVVGHVTNGSGAIWATRGNGKTVRLAVRGWRQFQSRRIRSVTASPKAQMDGSNSKTLSKLP